MKFIIRNFLTTLRRFKLSSGLNILGLSLAFSALIVMLIQIRYELSFDRFHARADAIFRVEGSTFNPLDEGLSPIHTHYFIQEFIHSSPHILAAGEMMLLGESNYFSVGETGAEAGFREIFIPADPGISEVFDFRMTAGDVRSLGNPYTVLIPESMARKIFGDGLAVGQVIKPRERIFMAQENTLFTIGGVYADFPANSQLHNAIYFPIDESAGISMTSGRNFQCYVLLDDPVNAGAVIDNFMEHYWREDANYASGLTLTPIGDIYYNPSLHDPLQKSGDRRITLLLIATALLIAVIAAINFTNFSVSLAPVRIRNINTQKILGNPVARIRAHLILEALGISLTAYLLALFLVYLFAQTGMAALLTADLSLGENAPALLVALGAAVGIGLVAGFYPAWYMTRFPPALVIKGAFGLSPKGRQLRSLLIGVQYTVSIVLLIAAGFVRLQNNFLMSHSPGFDQDRIIVAQLNTELYDSSHEVYAERLTAFAGIEDVAFAQQKFGAQEAYEGHGFITGDKDFSYEIIRVSPNFLDVLGIRLTAGRNFTESDRTRPDAMTLIINQKMHREHEVEIGRLSMHGQEMEVAGIVEDIHSSSLRRAVGPMAFVIQTNLPPELSDMPVSYIRITPGTDLQEAVGHIRRTVHDLDPTYPLEVEIFDQITREKYASEIRLSKLVTLFCLLAVVLSLVGVFGLVMFETQYRRKEIGVRKVFGATVKEILTMMNRTYIKIVSICFVIGAPAAFILVRKWLESFSYRTPIHGWVFALALLTMLVITSLTVLIQSYRAALENLARSLSRE